MNFVYSAAAFWVRAVCAVRGLLGYFRNGESDAVPHARCQLTDTAWQALELHLRRNTANSPDPPFSQGHVPARTRF